MQAFDLAPRAPRVRSVSIQPGSTALTWMLSLRPGAGHGAGHLHDAALGGGVGRGERGAEDRHHRADVDDLAAARLLHLRIGRLRAQEGAGQVGARGSCATRPGVYSCGCLRMLMPALLTRMSSRPKRSTVACTSALQEASLRDVDLDRGGLGAEPCQLLDRRGVLGRVARRRPRPWRRAREAARHAEADAAVAAGDDRDPAGEIEEIHGCPLLLALRRKPSGGVAAGEGRRASAPALGQRVRRARRAART